MIRVVLSRIRQALLVLLAVTFAGFVLFEFIGDPVQNMLGPEATQKEHAVLRAQLGLDDPLAVRFARYVGNVATGNLGISYRFGRPVSDLLAERTPATVELALVAAIIAIGAGTLLGVFVATHEGSSVANIILTGSLLGVSLPTFVTGTFLIYVFAVTFDLLPAFGRGETIRIGGWWQTGLLTSSGLKSLILPGLTLGLFQIAVFIRLVRSEMTEVLKAEFVIFARARGLPSRSILFRHALRNALVPVVTIAGVTIGGLLGYTVITEAVFQWPGLSSLFMTAIQYADIPVLSAYLVLISAIFVSVNFLVDLLYLAIDPRLRRPSHGTTSTAW